MENRKIEQQELKEILKSHSEWLAGNKFGKRADLSGADLRYANLSYADLRSADLSSANLRYADLRYANLSYADLRYANLSSANLSSANLSSADLRYANLSYADLRYADLSYADLRYADLSYADLLIFRCNRHTAYFTLDGTLRIGCECLPISEWLEVYKEMGKANSYTDLEIEAYGDFIKTCAKVFERTCEVESGSENE